MKKIFLIAIFLLSFASLTALPLELNKNDDGVEKTIDVSRDYHMVDVFLNVENVDLSFRPTLKLSKIIYSNHLEYTKQITETVAFSSRPMFLDLINENKLKTSYSEPFRPIYQEPLKSNNTVN